MMRHRRVVERLRKAAGSGRSDVFEFLFERVTESSGQVKQAFRAYTEHLEQHECSRGPVEAAVQLPGSGAVRAVLATR